ncbi:hypothetical protein KOI35_25915 [Actinoplanes bogorensis]|uniref:Lipoprotein n=1 Tax=Paractinoplanes bogorensis TaxID=1610840 RepID=A0ABS5YU18_9ACTN|nr:hypothetical protein [Actinoplanes bogorensis]MBU2666952.1 hypothetical protein [Actinoplanes bogorensis]
MRIVLAVVLLMLAGCTATKPPAAAPTSSSAQPCGSPVKTGALPEWARGGFNYDGSGTRQVYGDRGDIVAIVFGYPLVSPPGEDRSNKILWVSREPVQSGGDLQITAELAGTTVRAEQKVAGGPGPSIVDLPRAGCWHVSLAWSGHTDTMDLTYEP